MPMLTGRRLGVAAALALACSPLAACSGSSPAPAAPNGPAQDANTNLTGAMQAYHQFLTGNADMLASATKAFTDAIRAGNIAKAKQQYVIAHPYFEQGEPIMDKFDDLEKSIDLRPNDGTDITTVTGFHRLEKALWGDNSADGMAQIATKLDTDIATLRGNLQQAQFTAADFVQGAAGLLKEVADRNTGEDEDAFSHTDLYDIAGNIAGVEKGFSLLEPAISAKDSALASDVKQKLSTVDSTLAKFKQGNGYPDFTTVGAADRKAIGTAIGDAAQALGKVSSALT